MVGVSNNKITSSLESAALWSSLPECTEFLTSMTKAEIELQERWFEFFTSERSYNKTLKTLENVLIFESKCILDTYDLNLIYTLQELKSIIDMSDKFLTDLENRLKEDIRINSIFDIVANLCDDTRFGDYLRYASFQYSQKENFDRLMNENTKFNKVIKSLLSDSRLEGKDVLSYLIAPLQRLPRYKLLVDAVLNTMSTISDKDSKAYSEGLKLSQIFDQVILVI